MKVALALVPAAAAALVLLPAIPAASGDAPPALRATTVGSSPVVAAPRAPAGISAAIPAVAFTAEVVVRDGRLRTPVLLADPSVTAVARVVGASGAGCRADLRQGVPAWLDCPVGADRRVRISVALSDGRVVVREADRVVRPTLGPSRANIS